MLQPYAANAGKTHSKLAIVGLGANLSSEIGTPQDTIRHAIELLKAENVQIQDVSRLFCTPCVPKGAGPDYVNAVLILTTNLGPRDLLSCLHSIEKLLGRERSIRWGQRVLDLDLLAYGDKICPDLATFQHWRELPPEQQTKLTPDQLILPHPRIQDRAFVLAPLVEIAPNWQHPVLQRSARQLLDDLDPSDIAEIVPI